jgi:uncharacterized protein (DUF2062 family)
MRYAVPAVAIAAAMRLHGPLQVRWIPVGADCANAEALAAALTYVGDGNTSHAGGTTVTAGPFTFPVSLAGQQLSLCYAHGAGAEAYRPYNVVLSVSEQYLSDLVVYANQIAK